MEPTPAVYPTLTNEQKLAIREAQFQVYRVREQATAAVQTAEQGLNKVVENLAKELNVQDAVLNFVDLTIGPKQ